MSKAGVDSLKYEFVRRRTFDYFADRQRKHIDYLRGALADQELQIEALAKEVQILGFRINPDKVQIESGKGSD